jgi:hypothetical protein
VPVYHYIRAAVGPDAGRRIQEEYAIYGQQPHHVRHQRRQQATSPVGIAVQSRREIGPALEPYSGTIPVIRGLPVDPDDLEEWISLARFFAPEPALSRAPGG